MDTKRCPVCKEVKPRDEFNKNKYNKDGLQSRCRKCSSIARKKYEELNPEYGKKRKARKQTEAYKLQQQQYRQRPIVKQRARDYYRTKLATSEEYLRKEKERKSTQEYVDYHREYARNYYHKPEHRQKHRARWKVKELIRQGKIPPANTLKCEWGGCANQASDYHHYNGYEKEHWFDIQALCSKHHGFTRRKII